MRALAVVSMVQGHTFSALLPRDAMPSSVARWHAVIHGLTAPAFLFGAGLAFGLTTYSQYQRFQGWNEAQHKRLRRYMVLILTGYAVQLPGGPFALLHASSDHLRAMLRVGPLQLIGIVLGLCQLAIMVLPTLRKHALLMAACALAAMWVATPIAHAGIASHLGLFFGSFFDDRGGAHFPLFPWAAFVFLGVACAGLLHARQQWLRASTFLVSGAVLAGGAYLTYQSASAHPPEGWLWRTSPSFLLYRLGLVVVLLGLMHRRADRAAASSPHTGFSSLLARHSLVAYVVHLFLLYGTPFTPGLASFCGKSLNVPQACLMFGLVMAATAAVARMWDWLEHNKLIAHGRGSLLMFTLALLVR